MFHYDPIMFVGDTLSIIFFAIHSLFAIHFQIFFFCDTLSNILFCDTFSNFFFAIHFQIFYFAIHFQIFFFCDTLSNLFFLRYTFKSFFAIPFQTFLQYIKEEEKKNCIPVTEQLRYNKHLIVISLITILTFHCLYYKR